jgi:two-component system, NtrC family, nitrogen regulation sensor histidine kinase NtrY
MAQTHDTAGPQERLLALGWRPALRLGSFGALAFAVGAIASGQPGWAMAAASALVVIASIAFGLKLQAMASRPLATAANVLDALRHGDYMHRARTDSVRGPVASLLGEVNELARHLEAERRRGEETSALLEALIQRLDVALLAFDEQDELVWWNPAAEALFRTRLRRGAPAEVLGAEGFLRGPSERSVTLADQQPSESWELRRGVFHRAGERYRFVLLSSAQRLRREEERGAWQRLLRVLGHEVNNTLAPIQSMAATCRDLLADDDDGGTHLQKVLRALDAIEHRSASLAGFIGEFARLARLPEPRPVSMDLAEHVRRVAALDARCEVRVAGSGSLDILADPPLLEQALINLIRNAVDVSAPANGRVTIDWHADGGSVVLSIIDEGPGISNPDNLFVPLFSTKPGGSGIGLVLARNVIEAHQGQLKLTNRLDGKGCVARVILPLAARAAPSSTPGQST